MRRLSRTFRRKSMTPGNDSTIHETGSENGEREEDEEDIVLDPSIIVPDGIKRKIRRQTLESPPDVRVFRQAMTVDRKHARYNYEKPHNPGVFEKIKKSVKKKSQCSTSCLKDFLYLRLPILDWLFHYKLKKDLLNDVIAGVTVAVMNIPQATYPRYSSEKVFSMTRKPRQLRLIPTATPRPPLQPLDVKASHPPALPLRDLPSKCQPLTACLKEAVGEFFLGMAYAMLAGLDPIYGIYMAFFPVLVYATFATSRHNSMGTFAVVCIMTGQVVTDLATTDAQPESGDMLLEKNVTGYSPVEVSTMVSFACSIWMFIFAIFNLGSLSVFLSEMLVSGFTSGASIHVLTSQVPKIFGLDNLPSYRGIFKIPKIWASIFTNLFKSNSATMVISFVCLFVLIINNEVLKPKLKEKTRIPFPIELVVVVFGTVGSYFGKLNEAYGVEIVGDIPTGLPAPKPPPFELYGQVLISSFTISIVSFSISFSMAKIFAKKLDYPVDATQELYATGLANVFGSFFSCAPIAASLSRSLVQQTVGGATQLASYISCSILVLVLLFLGPYFSTLPNSVLAAIIAVALKGMFLQVGDFFRMWKISRLDAAVWLVTFLSVVILDIDVGLMVGIVTVLLLLIVRNQAFKIVPMGRIPDTDIYLDKTRYTSTQEMTGVKICQVIGSLHFANQEAFRQQIAKVSGIEPKIILKWKKKQEKLLRKNLKMTELKNGNSKETLERYSEIEKSTIDTDIEKQEMGSNKSTTPPPSPQSDKYGSMPKLSNNDKLNSAMIVPEIASLIVDLSCVSQIDVAAAKNLLIVQKEYTAAGVVLVFAGTLESVLEVMGTCGVLEALAEEVFFHTVPDAVAFLIILPKRNSRERSVRF